MTKRRACPMKEISPGWASPPPKPIFADKPAPLRVGSLP